MVTVSPTPLASQPTIDDEIVCLGSSTGLHANVGMGNCNAYAVSNIPFAPIPGSGTAVTLGDDAVSPALSIGFSFVFFCSAYNSFYLSSNGLMAFSAGQGNGCCSGQMIPNAVIPNNVIGFAWEDLNPTAGGSINYLPQE